MDQSDLCTYESGWTGDSYETEHVADTSSSLSGSGTYYIRIHFQFKREIMITVLVQINDQ